MTRPHHIPADTDFEHVLADAGPLDRVELRQWIEARWVAPQGNDGNWRFTALDVARVRLIREMRHDLGVEAETVPMVLSLLDQLHATRRRLHTLLHALDRAPPELVEAVRAAVVPDTPAGDAPEED